MKNEIKVRDLIKFLVEFSMDAVIYIGDGESLKKMEWNNLSWNSNDDVSDSDDSKHFLFKDSRKKASEIYFTPSDSYKEGWRQF